MQIGRRAVGDRTMGHGETRYAAAGGSAQQRHIEGLPLGTRGGLAVAAQLSARCRVRAHRASRVAGGRLGQPDGAARVLQRPERRARVQRRARSSSTSGGARGCACRRARTASASRSSTSSAAPASTSSTPARSRSAAPSRASSSAGRTTRAAPATRRAAARSSSASLPPRPRKRRAPAEILTRLATRAYRRPVPTADGDEVQLLLEFYRLGRQEGGDFEAASSTRCRGCSSIRTSSIGSSVSPPTSRSAASTRSATSSSPRGSSFFLWSSIPDDELLAVAAAGELHEPDVARGTSRAAARRTNARSASSKTSPASG